MNKHTPITLLVTYAPRQGYKPHEKTEHWGEVQQTLKEIPKHHMTLWGADANGQLGKEEETKIEQYQKIIGPYTTGKTRKGKWHQTRTTMQTTQHDPNEHMA